MIMASFVHFVVPNGCGAQPRFTGRYTTAFPAGVAGACPLGGTTTSDTLSIGGSHDAREHYQRTRLRLDAVSAQLAAIRAGLNTVETCARGLETHPVPHRKGCASCVVEASLPCHRQTREPGQAGTHRNAKGDGPDRGIEWWIWEMVLPYLPLFESQLGATVELHFALGQYPNLADHLYAYPRLHSRASFGRRTTPTLTLSRAHFAWYQEHFYECEWVFEMWWPRSTPVDTIAFGRAHEPFQFHDTVFLGQTNVSVYPAWLLRTTLLWQCGQVDSELSPSRRFTYFPCAYGGAGCIRVVRGVPMRHLDTPRLPTYGRVRYSLPDEPTLVQRQRGQPGFRAHNIDDLGFFFGRGEFGDPVFERNFCITPDEIVLTALDQPRTPNFEFFGTATPGTFNADINALAHDDRSYEFRYLPCEPGLVRLQAQAIARLVRDQRRAERKQRLEGQHVRFAGRVDFLERKIQWARTTFELLNPPDAGYRRADHSYPALDLGVLIEFSSFGLDYSYRTARQVARAGSRSKFDSHVRHVLPIGASTGPSLAHSHIARPKGRGVAFDTHVHITFIEGRSDPLLQLFDHVQELAPDHAAPPGRPGDKRNAKGDGPIAGRRPTGGGAVSRTRVFDADGNDVTEPFHGVIRCVPGPRGPGRGVTKYVDVSPATAQRIPGSAKGLCVDFRDDTWTRLETGQRVVFEPYCNLPSGLISCEVHFVHFAEDAPVVAAIYQNGEFRMATGAHTELIGDRRIRHAPHRRRIVDGDTATLRLFTWTAQYVTAEVLDFVHYAGDDSEPDVPASPAAAPRPPPPIVVPPLASAPRPPPPIMAPPPQAPPVVPPPVIEEWEPWRDRYPSHFYLEPLVTAARRVALPAVTWEEALGRQPTAEEQRAHDLEVQRRLAEEHARQRQRWLTAGETDSRLSRALLLREHTELLGLGDGAHAGRAYIALEAFRTLHLLYKHADPRAYLTLCSDMCEAFMRRATEVAHDTALALGVVEDVFPEAAEQDSPLDNATLWTEAMRDNYTVNVLRLAVQSTVRAYQTIGVGLSVVVEADDPFLGVAPAAAFRPTQHGILEDVFIRRRFTTTRRLPLSSIVLPLIDGDIVGELIRLLPRPSDDFARRDVDSTHVQNACHALRASLKGDSVHKFQVFAAPLSHAIPGVTRITRDQLRDTLLTVVRSQVDTHAMATCQLLSVQPPDTLDERMALIRLLDEHDYGQGACATTPRPDLYWFARAAGDTMTAALGMHAAVAPLYATLNFPPVAIPGGAPQNAQNPVVGAGWGNGLIYRGMREWHDVSGNCGMAAVDLFRDYATSTDGLAQAGTPTRTGADTDYWRFLPFTSNVEGILLQMYRDTGALPSEVICTSAGGITRSMPIRATSFGHMIAEARASGTPEAKPTLRLSDAILYVRFPAAGPGHCTLWLPATYSPDASPTLNGWDGWLRPWVAQLLRRVKIDIAPSTTNSFYGRYTLAPAILGTRRRPFKVDAVINATAASRIALFSFDALRLTLRRATCQTHLRLCLTVSEAHPDPDNFNVTARRLYEPFPRMSRGLEFDPYPQTTLGQCVCCAGSVVASRALVLAQGRVAQGVIAPAVVAATARMAPTPYPANVSAVAVMTNASVRQTHGAAGTFETCLTAYTRKHHESLATAHFEARLRLLGNVEDQVQVYQCTEDATPMLWQRLKTRVAGLADACACGRPALDARGCPCCIRHRNCRTCGQVLGPMGTCAMCRATPNSILHYTHTFLQCGDELTMLRSLGHTSNGVTTHHLPRWRLPVVEGLGKGTVELEPACRLTECRPGTWPMRAGPVVTGMACPALFPLVHQPSTMSYKCTLATRFTVRMNPMADPLSMQKFQEWADVLGKSMRDSLKKHGKRAYIAPWGTPRFREQLVEAVAHFEPEKRHRYLNVYDSMAMTGTPLTKKDLEVELFMKYENKGGFEDTQCIAGFMGEYPDNPVFRPQDEPDVAHPSTAGCLTTGRAIASYPTMRAAILELVAVHEVLKSLAFLFRPDGPLHWATHFFFPCGANRCETAETIIKLCEKFNIAYLSEADLKRFDSRCRAEVFAAASTLRRCIHPAAYDDPNVALIIEHMTDPQAQSMFSIKCKGGRGQRPERCMRGTTPMAVESGNAATSTIGTLLNILLMINAILRERLGVAAYLATPASLSLVETLLEESGRAAAVLGDDSFAGDTDPTLAGRLVRHYPAFNHTLLGTDPIEASRLSELTFLAGRIIRYRDDAGQLRHVLDMDLARELARTPYCLHGTMDPAVWQLATAAARVITFPDRPFLGHLDRAALRRSIRELHGRKLDHKTWHFVERTEATNKRRCPDIPIDEDVVGWIANSGGLMAAARRMADPDYHYKPLKACNMTGFRASAETYVDYAAAYAGGDMAEMQRIDAEFREVAERHDTSLAPVTLFTGHAIERALARSLKRGY